MEMTKPIAKGIGYAYASSTTAEYLGHKKDGCYYVYTRTASEPNKEIILPNDTFATRRQAAAHLATIDAPICNWSLASEVTA